MRQSRSINHGMLASVLNPDTVIITCPCWCSQFCGYKFNYSTALGYTYQKNHQPISLGVVCFNKSLGERRNTTRIPDKKEFINLKRVAQNHVKKCSADKMPWSKYSDGEQYSRIPKRGCSGIQREPLKHPRTVWNIQENLMRGNLKSFPLVQSPENDMYWIFS